MHTARHIVDNHTHIHHCHIVTYTQYMSVLLGSKSTVRLEENTIKIVNKEYINYERNKSVELR